MKMIRRIFDLRAAPVLSAVFILLVIAEGKRPLRVRKRPKLRRMVTNALVSIPSFTLLRFMLLPVMVKLAIKNRDYKLGLNYQYKAGSFSKGFLAFLLLDYTNYLWHVLNHKLPLLWRFHLVHHCDPDLDVSTALRFHFGELIGSVFYRGSFVLLSGASPLTVLFYEACFETATQFHHSNWKLPFRLEKSLNQFIVTPRMHGIHHSDIQEHADSNYSVIFSFWDRLHKTARLHISQDSIDIGVSSNTNADNQTVAYLLRLPFARIQPVLQKGANEATASSRNNNLLLP